MTTLPPNRMLTDDDIDELVKRLTTPVATKIREQMIVELKLDIGNTVLRLAWRAFVSLVVVLGLIWASHSYGWIERQAAQPPFHP